MQKIIPIKLVSQLILIVLLTVMINGVHESAHAMQSHVSYLVNQQTLHTESCSAQHCPCAPQEQHKDFDGCDTCTSCACHAPLTVETFALRYDPVVVMFRPFDSFKYLPEVFLSKFIPPQNLV